MGLDWVSGGLGLWQNNYMDVILTGTGSPLPDPNRAGPSTLIKVNDCHVLVDAGRGVVMRMAGAGSLPLFLSAVLITHLHSDHICDLNDVITTHWIMSQGEAVLSIYGPPGTEEFVNRQIHALEADISYRIEHHQELTNGPQVQVVELAPGEHFTIGEVFVRTEATEHAPVKPTLGYRIEHNELSVALVGDTVPCNGVDELARDVDAYVQTVIRSDLVGLSPNSMMLDILDYHSDVQQAAQTAERVNAKRLLLTHMVPAPNKEQYSEWVSEARKHFRGEIVIGDDLTTVSLQRTP